MSLARRNTKKTFTQKDRRSFYLVGSDVFYGLVFAEKQSYYYKNNRTLVTIPSFTFYSSQTKVIVDYSNSRNIDDLSFVSSFFNSMTPGVTFEFKNANFVQDGSQIYSNLSGIYSFESFEQDKIIKASIVSTTNLSNKKDFYASKFFTAAPQLSKIGGVSTRQQKSNVIKNTVSNGLYSFSKLGVQLGDYIEFSGTSNNERKKFKVIDLFTDSDGFETLQVDSEVENENLIGSSVLVNMYFEGEPSTTIDITNKTYGSCRYIVNGEVTRCFSCQNEYQCTERGLRNKVETNYKRNVTCEDIATAPESFAISVAPGITLEQALIAAATTTETTQVANPLATPVSISFTRPKVNLKVVSVKIRTVSNVKSLVETENFESTISAASNSLLKINLQDFTLAGFSFDFYDSDTSTVPISKNVAKVGTPGKGGSYISLQLDSNKKAVYLKTAQNKNLVFTVTVN